MATTLEQIEQSTATTLLSTEFNSLANGSNTSAGSAVNNVQATANLNGYTRAKIELYLAAYSGTPSANTSINVWFLRTVDGTNYEDGSSSVAPARNPDVVIPVNATASGPQRIIRECFLPVGSFKPLAKNTIGISLAGSGNTLKILPNTDQGV
jgi:hypothetical protein